MQRRSLYAKEDRPSLHLRADATIDVPFFVILLVLLGLGLLMLYSASCVQSSYDSGNRTTTLYLRKQALCAAVGLVAFLLFSRIPSSVWFRSCWILYAGSILLLMGVLVLGQEVNGAKRWISIGGIQFQPSELAKFTMILVIARLTREYGPRAKRFRFGVLGFGSALVGILIPLALEKHLSAIMLMGMVAVVMMYIAGTDVRWLLAGALAAVAFVLVYIRFMGYAGDRVSAWLHPEQDPGDTGYQILQSLYAVGSGGLFGLGLGLIMK